MAKTLNSKYKVLNTYALRTPLFSLRKLFSIYESDCTKTALWNLFEHPAVKEAIYLGSPRLYDQIMLFLTNDDFSKERERKLSIGVLKYVTRLCSRCTPFGLFAGMSIGHFDDDNRIILDNIILHRRKTRLDFEFLAQLSKSLVNDPKVCDGLKFYVNTSLYQCANQLRYIETIFDQHGKNYSLQRIVPNEILEAILQFVRYGQSYCAIVDFVVDFHFEKNEAKEYINTLIGFQILVSSITPYTIGKDYTTHIMEELAGHKNLPAMAFINRFYDSAKRLDKQIGNDVEHYKSLLKDASSLNSNLKIDHFVQVDLYPKYKSNILSRNLKILISRALDIICTLFEPNYSKEMLDFVRAYVERYETKTMSLVDVLDIDYGIGYPVNSNKSRFPYLENLDLQANKKNHEEPISLKPIEHFLLQLIEENPNQILDLAKTDLSSNMIKDPKLKVSHYAVGEVIIENNTTKLFLDGFGGSSATDLLGRFSQDSPKTKALLEEIVHLESCYHDDEIVAEIAHLPEDRTGNILFRPQLRDFQINFLSGVNQNKDRDIDITDIMISLQGQRIVLTSKRHGKQIVPYLSNAHNYLSSKLPLYRFLCDYQYHNHALNIGFSWGQLPKIRHHLPRVCYKDVILAKEQWVFQTKELRKVLKKSLDNASLMDAVEKWTIKEGLPRYVQLKQRDKLLLIDLKNPLSIRMLLDTIPTKDTDSCTLIEFLHGNETVVHNDKGHRFAGEFVFMLAKNKKAHVH